MDAPRLRDVIQHVYVVAYREDTDRLERALRREGFETSIVRTAYTPEEMTWSRSVRVVVNHLNAWRKAAAQDGLVMVVEADFVPCIGLGAMPLPFDIEQADHSWGWLYSCGPTVYELRASSQGVAARGHSAAPVATIMGPETARALIEFGEGELAEKDPHAYTNWDTYVRKYVQDRGINSFLAFRNYGEHGGPPNPEHAESGNVTATHRADALMARLHFLPEYANGSRLRYLRVRSYAKLKGWGRLFCLRMLERPTLRSATLRQRWRLVRFAAGRLLSVY